MTGTTIRKSLRVFAAAMPLLLAGLVPALAQYAPPPPAPMMSNRNPTCLRYETQLASLDRGTFDPARAAEIKRWEEQAGKQQGDLDRLTQQAAKMGCKGGGFFALFSGQPAQCGPLNNQIQQTRSNIDGIMGEIQRLQGNSADREGQRRALLAALGQNDCGPQYRRYANQGPGAFFENLFGIQTSTGGDVPLSGTYRTVCVRTCDGYYFPISFSTVPSKFGDDEQLCQRLCPATEATLYTHRNPGEDITRAVSSSTGRTYTELPNAFAYRKAFNNACSCRAPGQSWADALRQLDDYTVERGDIVVQTEEQAKALSQPRIDAQGRPIRPEAAAGSRLPGAAPRGGANVQSAPLPAVTPAPATAEGSEQPDPKRQVRTVGPTFLPAR